MKIALISPVKDRCGVSDYTHDFLRALEQYVEVTPYSFPAKDHASDWMDLAQRINAQGNLAHIQYHPDYCGYWKSPRTVRHFSGFLKEITIPTLMTVHDLFAGLKKRPGQLWNFRRMFYNLVLVPYINQTLYGKYLLGGFLNQADHLMTHSRLVKNFLISLGIPESKISLLYAGVPAMSSRPKDSRNNRVNITIFGFVTPDKGYEVALEALKKLPESVVLVIAGGLRSNFHRPYMKKIQGMIKALGLEKRVNITGYLEKKDLELRILSSDILLLPYRKTEMTGFSYALNYALSSKRPVIAADTPYFQEVADVCPWIQTFPEGNAQALIESVQRNLMGANKREEEGRDFFCSEWSWDKVAEKIAAIYEKVIGETKQ